MGPWIGDRRRYDAAWLFRPPQAGGTCSTGVVTAQTMWLRSHPSQFRVARFDQIRVRFCRWPLEALRGVMPHMRRQLFVRTKLIEAADLRAKCHALSYCRPLSSNNCSTIGSSAVATVSFFGLVNLLLQLLMVFPDVDRRPSGCGEDFLQPCQPVRSHCFVQRVPSDLMRASRSNAVIRSFWMFRRSAASCCRYRTNCCRSRQRLWCQPDFGSCSRHVPSLSANGRR